jgi:hypothetical protein
VGIGQGASTVSAKKATAWGTKAVATLAAEANTLTENEKIFWDLCIGHSDGRSLLEDGVSRALGRPGWRRVSAA